MRTEMIEESVHGVLDRGALGGLARLLAGVQRVLLLVVLRQRAVGGPPTRSGTGGASRLSRPLRTARAGFPARSSSLHNRPSRDAALFVPILRLCFWRLPLSCDSFRVCNDLLPP